MIVKKEGTRQSLISVRGGFSENNGIGLVSNAIQITEFDNKTRTIISNKLRDILEAVFDGDASRVYYKMTHKEVGNEFCKSVLSDVFGEQNRLEQGHFYNWRKIFDTCIYNVICNAYYNEVLDIIWFVCDWLVNNINLVEDMPYCVMNGVFEKECVGYRFVDGKIVEITDEQEIKAIEDAAVSQFEGCNAHIANAVTLLADRERKDYKNCIKESISAVESICQIITKDPKATLGGAIKKLKENGTTLHPALESAFSKLYGYTTDKGGIRHAEGLFVSDVSFEEAKFMLVCCSAFVNYLIAEMGKMKNA